MEMEAGRGAGGVPQENPSSAGGDMEIPSSEPTAAEVANTAKRAKVVPENGTEEQNRRRTFSFKSGRVKVIRPVDPRDLKRQLACEHDQRSDLFKILRHFFVCAFTIIIKTRKLSPSEAFRYAEAFGIKVPVFRHPASLEYVTEVSKKITTFVRGNCCDGAVIHVMIEKNKALHVVQRFVFRTNGSLDFLNNLDDDESEIFDMEEFKSNCRNALLRIMNAEAIKPMAAPQYSRWSISIGMKKSFVDEVDIVELWRADPSENYFPWKKRLRSLASIQKEEESAVVAAEEMCPDAEKTRGSIEINSTNLPSVNGTESKSDEENKAHKANGNSSATAHDGTETSTNVCENKPSQSASHTSHTLATNNNGDKGKTICFPLASFPVTANFMLLVYGLEYAAPTTDEFNSSVFSPRVPRSSSSGSLRMSQIRQRLLKYSNR